jgi:hypothetical protein|nr:MAG TPA: internal head protein [Caudoviricetes sp.]
MATYGLIASLEDLEEAQMLNEEVSTDEVDNAALETELLDVQEQSNEIDTMDRDLDVATDAVDSLESLVESLKLMQKEGNFTRSTAAMYNHAKESIYARLGMECRDDQFLSLESFGDEQSTKHTLSVTIEEEQSTIRKVWEAIKKFVVQMFNKVMALLGNITNGAQEMARKAQSLMNLAEFKPGYNMTADEKKKYGSAFAIGQKSEDLVTISNNLVNFFNERTVTNLTTGAVAMLKEVALMYENKKSESDAHGKYMKSLYDNFTQNNNIKEVWDRGEGEYMSSETLPGGYGLRAFLSKDKDEFSFGMVTKEKAVIEYSDDKLPKDLAAAKAIGKNMFKLAGVIRSSQATVKSKSAEAKKIFDSINAKEDAKTNYAKNMQAIFKSLVTTTTAMSNYELKKGKEIIDLALKASKGSTAKEETKKEAAK